MVKRVKKPPVPPEKRKEWLARSERGESVPQIASKDFVDVRTIRKHIELARQELEAHESRVRVLSDALQRHYGDLCTFADKISSELKLDKGKLASLKSDRMWTALQQHLPRSIMLTNLDKWEKLRGDILNLGQQLLMMVEEQIEFRLKSKLNKSPMEMGLNDSIIRGIYADIRDSAYSSTEPLSKYNLDRLPKSEDKTVENIIRDLLSESGTWDEYSKLRQYRSEFNRLQETLDEELALITLRRVVPGKCKYCPM